MSEDVTRVLGAANNLATLSVHHPVFWSTVSSRFELFSVSSGTMKVKPIVAHDARLITSTTLDLDMNVDRSYVFRLSAPTAVTGGVTTAASAKRTLAEDITSQKEQMATGGGEHESNGVKETAPSTMPPTASLGERKKQSGKVEDDSDEPSEKWPQPEATGRKASDSDVEAEREAMQKANLPSTFGAVRDKPLGKRAVREAHIMRGVAGVAITAAGGRFATGLGAAPNRDAPASRSTPDDEILDKAEARKKREAEIAALTAELSRRDPDDVAGREEGKEDSSEAVKFIPGGWRHASSNNRKGSSGRPKRDENEESKVISAGDGRLPEQNGDREEEEPMGEEEEEEEEMTEEMRIKMIVRRLGLPVSHEVKLSGHRKGVMALALDRAGGRVATGSNDYKVCPSILLCPNLVVP